MGSGPCRASQNWTLDKLGGIAGTMISEFPSGQHTGTVTTKGWRRENACVDSHYDIISDGVKIRIHFQFAYSRKFLRTKRVFNIILFPSLGPGWDFKWASVKFTSGPTTVMFPAQIIDKETGSITYNIKPEFVDMMDDFFATMDTFTFEVHGPSGIVFGFPLSHKPETYSTLSAAIKRSIG